VEDSLNSDAVNTTNAVLDTVDRLGFDQSDTDLQQELHQFRTEVEELAQLDDAEQQEQEFRARLENHEQQIREFSEELGSVSVSRLNFRLRQIEDDDLTTQQLRRYHARAKQQIDAESNADVARQAYRHYLKQQAEKNGWE
jgi:TolA-binding protein